MPKQRLLTSHRGRATNRLRFSAPLGAQKRPAKGCSSGVERRLDTAKVGGSKPPSPTNLSPGQARLPTGRYTGGRRRPQGPQPVEADRNRGSSTPALIPRGSIATIRTARLGAPPARRFHARLHTNAFASPPTRARQREVRCSARGGSCSRPQASLRRVTSTRYASLELPRRVIGL